MRVSSHTTTTTGSRRVVVVANAVLVGGENVTAYVFEPRTVHVNGQALIRIPVAIKNNHFGGGASPFPRSHPRRFIAFDTQQRNSKKKMVVPKPSNEILLAKIKELVWTVDLETVSLKAFIQLLSSHLDHIDLKPRKAFIKEALTKVLTEGQERADKEDGSSAAAAEEEQESEEEEEEEEVKTSASKQKGGGGGLKAVKKLSDELANFIGKGQSMARTEVVKSIWEYIKEHQLQNPENKREILLDAKMRDVFGVATFTMFTMNKYLSAHIEPFKPVDLTTNSSSPSSTASRTPSKRKTKSDAAASSSNKKQRRTSSSGNKNDNDSSKKKKKTSNQPPYRLSQELTAVVGTDILPRPQVVKQLWIYIKSHDLQDPADKRRIICDDLLQQVFKKPKISMFAMNAELSRHLYERVDRSEYHPDNISGSSDHEDKEVAAEDDGAE
jgi:upstream activation factor subunit UAF30